MIDDLLRLARITRAGCGREVDLTTMARDLADSCGKRSRPGSVRLAIEPDLKCRGDAHLLRVVLDNLLRNSWKYSAKQAEGDHRVCLDQSERRAGVLHPGQRGRLRHEVRGQAVRRLPAAAFALGFRRHRRRPRHGPAGDHPRTAGRIWAKGAVERGRDILLHASPTAMRR